MTTSETQRTALNYNNEPLKDGEVLVLMRFDENERENITNPNSFVTVPTAGGPVKAVLKAVPKEFEAAAKEQFNSWVREARPVHYGRCLIPQPDGTKKVCPKKNGNNHPDCAHCPHNGEYEREMPKVVSLEGLQENGWDPAYSGFPEPMYIRKEEKKESFQKVKATLNDLLEASPKHAYALCLTVQNVTGDQFYEKMQLGHDAAVRVKNQISEYVAENGLDNFSQFEASRTKLDKYYREETVKILKDVLDTLLGLTVEK